MKMRPIDVLNNLKGHVLWPQSYHLSKAEAEACIKALEQELCDDAISRQAAIKAFKPRGIAEDVWQECNEYKVLSSLPPVNPQVKTGHWSHDGSHWKNRFICLRCGYKLFDEPTNYCPDCGAKMEREDNE